MAIEIRDRLNWIALVTAAVMLSVQSPAAAQGARAPSDLNEFGLICFCNSRVATPHMPISFDNNGEVLFLARDGTTREALHAAGAVVSESQIQMLKDWGLLTERDKRLVTAFPVLEPSRMAALRQSLAPLQRAILGPVLPHVRAIKGELARRGQQEATYATMFAYVLDGLVWEVLEGTGKMPSTDITVERPYWAGTFWAVYPKQDFMPGTNTRSSGRAALKMMWNPAVLERVNALYASAPAKEWLEQANEGRPAAGALFADRKAAPVVIREDLRDPIHLHGSRIAEIVAGAIAPADLSRALPAADESRRLLIGTHELIWAVLADVVTAEKVAIPKVLTSGASRDEDLGPLVIGVIKAPKSGSPN